MGDDNQDDESLLLLLLLLLLQRLRLLMTGSSKLLLSGRSEGGEPVGLSGLTRWISGRSETEATVLAEQLEIVDANDELLGDLHNFGMHDCESVASSFELSRTITLERRKTGFLGGLCGRRGLNVQRLDEEAGAKRRPIAGEQLLAPIWQG